MDRKTRLRTATAGAVIGTSAILLAACGSSSQPSVPSSLNASSSSSSQTAPAPTNLTLAQLEKEYPFDAANDLPIYQGDPNSVPLSNLLIPPKDPAIPVPLRVPKPSVLGAWVNDTSVPYVGPVYVGTKLTPLERDAVYTARTLGVMGGLYSSSYATTEQNGQVTVLPDVAQLFEPYAGNGPIPASTMLSQYLSTANANVAPAASFFASITPTNQTYLPSPKTFYQQSISNKQFAVHPTKNAIDVVVCESSSSWYMVNGKLNVTLATPTWANYLSFPTAHAVADQPLESLNGDLYWYMNGQYGGSGNPPFPKWGRVCG